MSAQANVSNDDTPKMHIINLLPSTSTQVNPNNGESTEETAADEEVLTTKMLSPIITSTFEEEEDEFSFDAEHLENYKVTEESTIEQAGIAYIAGYLAYRTRGKDRTLGTPTGHLNNVLVKKQTSPQTWINKVSEGGLLQPNPEFLENVYSMENVFKEFNHASDMINKNPNYIKNLVMKMSSCVPNLSESVVKIFARTRMYIRIMELNSKIEQEKRQKSEKKMKKTVK